MEAFNQIRDGLVELAKKAILIIEHIDMFEQIADFYERSTEGNLSLQHSSFWAYLQIKLLHPCIILNFVAIINPKDKILDEIGKAIETIKLEEEKKEMMNLLVFLKELRKKSETKEYQKLRHIIAHADYPEKESEKNILIYLAEVRKDTKQILEQIYAIFGSTSINRTKNIHTDGAHSCPEPNELEDFIESEHHNNSLVMNSLEYFLKQSICELPILENIQNF